MKKIKYLKFVDANERYGAKSEQIELVGEASTELIKEIGLEHQSKYHDGSGDRYLTTVGQLGLKGWELVFVTPCGININKGSSGEAGPILNSYIFKKDE